MSGFCRHAWPCRISAEVGEAEPVLGCRRWSAANWPSAWADRDIAKLVASGGTRRGRPRRGEVDRAPQEAGGGEQVGSASVPCRMRVGVDPGQVFRVWYSGWDDLGKLGLFLFNGPGFIHFVFKGLGLSL